MITKIISELSGHIYTCIIFTQTAIHKCYDTPLKRHRRTKEWISLFCTEEWEILKRYEIGLVCRVHVYCSLCRLNHCTKVKGLP